MKKATVLLAMFCICFQTVAVLAATAAPDFSGVWELDASQSKLPDAMSVQSMMLKVTQTEKEIKIDSYQTVQSSDGVTQRKMSVVRQTAAFDLTEGNTKTTSDVGSGATLGSEVRKASITADEKLSLTTGRLFSDPAKTAEKTNEIWELLDGGNTLKITRYTESASGATNAELFFKRKASGIKTQAAGTAENAEGAGIGSASGETVKKISGGVLNGKALILSKPEYPAAARAVQASGAVNVQITINEQGSVVAASAVSGHPLLRQAAEQAARASQFAPTLLQGAPVSVTGVLVYNFVP